MAPHRVGVMPSHSFKVPVVVRPGYLISLERFGAVTFGHIDVTAPYTPSLKRQIAADFQLVRQLQGAPVFIHVERTNTKLARFAQSFGFRLITSCTDAQGVNTDIYAI
ncbi:hypothetical protein [Teichococcus vastitatis]|uniref:Uncharacterized protein n=1 Tax=Teichococcus vastitatis TaxID=2307076 RepID=A0ABS9WBS9_9PROT|nr:hypothetical protein [Pseudoroseomonas vastitatis]MCI0756686.1 hypothetical protein [Pseudoroseomonas vastitatis]